MNERNNHVVHWLGLAALVFLLGGCAGFTVHSDLDRPEFVSENSPIWDIRTILVLESDGDVTEDQARELVATTSDLLLAQVGVRLKIVEPIRRIKLPIPTADPEEALSTVATYMAGTSAVRGASGDYDMAIAIYSDSILALAKQLLMIPSWAAAIDDGLCRCIIATKTLDMRQLAHEVVHGLILDYPHIDDFAGLMTPMDIQLIPGVPFDPVGRKYLLPETRQRALKGKFRDTAMPVKYEEMSPNKVSVQEK